MAAFDTTRPLATSGALTRFISNAFGTFAAWNDARVTRKSLSRLTARELDDIGLVSGDIDTIATRRF